MIIQKYLLPLHAQFYLKVMENNVFLVPLNGLTAGKTEFRWTAGKEFFESFGNSDILDASVSVLAEVEKSGQYIGIDCQIDGYMTVECDRCLSGLKLPVEVAARLSVKFGEEAGETFEGDDDREIICVPSADSDLDLGQIVYDYSCLSLPMQKVHPDGECDPDVVSRLGVMSEEKGEQEGSPFSALKDMFRN